MCSRCDQFSTIQSLISGIDYVDIISTTQDSCVVITPSQQLAIITADVLLTHGIISKTIRGHFIDCFYIIINLD